jgi:hypothetical protein
MKNIFFIRCPDVLIGRLWRIVLKKSFSGEERKFKSPQMRFAWADVRDHIISHKTHYRSSYPP